MEFSWIRVEPSRFNILVANGIALIKELTSSMVWKYVPTALNPAEILPIGALPFELCEFSVWMHGQSFLIGSEKDWPSASIVNFVEVYCCLQACKLLYFAAACIRLYLQVFQ